MGDNKTGNIWMQAAAGAASSGIGMGMQRIGVNYDYRKQREQTQKLMQMQMEAEKQMMDYQQMKQLEMWEKTGYGAQKAQMKAAGLNPALMYGMGGGGGQSVGGGMPSGPGAVASEPNTRGMGIQAGQQAMQTAMQMSLLKAQKENIEADTKSKLADATVKDQTQYGLGLDNALKLYLQSTDIKGEDADMKDSMTVEERRREMERTGAETRYKLDENERQKLMNSAVMNQIGAEITMLHKKGLSEDEIYRNLQKTGKLLDAEIEWNKLDIEKGNVGKFLTNVIKMLVKPR